MYKALKNNGIKDVCRTAKIRCSLVAPVFNVALTDVILGLFCRDVDESKKATYGFLR